MRTIWQFQETVSRRLLGWSIFSLFSGFGLWLDVQPTLRAIGVQFLTWGAIDGLLAVFGRRAARRKQAALPDPLDPAVTEPEARNLQRLLWINSGLDVIYLLVGALLYRRGNDARAAWRGHGIGVLVQGGFLLLFDVFHALRTPRQSAVRGQ